MSTESAAAITGDIAIALSFLAALGFGIGQVRSANRDRRERVTVATVRGMQTREMAAHFQWLGSFDMPSTFSAMRALPADEQVSIIHYAQQMEMLGLMVYDGMIELALVERTLGDYVAFSWEKYKSFTYDRRNEDPYLNEYFEWLAKRLDDYMRSNPRTPAYATTGAQSEPR
jgi:hypothetical protein